METKYFIDKDGNYLGGFEGALPPAGAIEVPLPPDDARFIWDGKAWTIPDALKDALKEEAVAAILAKQGIDENVVIRSIIKKFMYNDSTYFDQIKQAIDQATVTVENSVSLTP